MARVVLTAEERSTLTETRIELIALQEQILAAIEAGIQSPAMAAAAAEQITQIDALMENFS
jgi:hypothetical protein